MPVLEIPVCQRRNYFSENVQQEAVDNAGR